MSFCRNSLRSVFLFGVSALVFSSLSAQTDASKASGPDYPDETIELSPYVVEASAYNGYSATQTLSGTRLRTEMKDVASAVSVLTPEFLDDIGATNILGAFNFVPSTESFTVTDSDVTGNGGRYGTPFVVRGFTSNSITSNFFNLTMPVDRFNTEQISFNRGPNSILFGAGSPGGLADVSTKRAMMQGNRSEAELRYSTVGDGTWRASFDQNVSFPEQHLAFRVAALRQDGSALSTPSRDDRDSVYLTATYRPFQRTTIRTNVETGHSERTMVRPYIAYDYYTPWVNAGRPLVSGTTAPAVRTGLEQISANYSVVVEGSTLPVMNWGRLWKGARPIVNGVANGSSSFRSPVVLPLDTNVAGEGNLTKRDYQVYAAFIEQQLADHLFLEVAGQIEAVNQPDIDGLRGADLAVQVDANRTLPNGLANPYAGMPYLESSSYIIKSLESRDSWQSRITLSYELDLRERKLFRGLDLGRYQFALLESYSRKITTREDFVEVNTASSIADLSNAANRVHHRVYLEPNGPTSFTFANPPITQAAGANATVTPAISSRWARVIGVPRSALEELDGLSFVTQAKYWDDRVVLTAGVRRDSADSKTTTYVKNAIGEYPTPSEGTPGDTVTSSGTTRTLGTVFHLTPNLSLFMNKSDNFSPTSANNVDIFDRTVAPQQGQGFDTGLKFYLFNNRLVGSVGYFETDFQNEALSSYRGIKPNAVNDIWAVVDPSKTTLRTDWLDMRDSSARGVEMELVFNPTPNWRILVNGARNETKVSRVIPVFLEYLDTYRSVWEANATKPVLTTSSGTTVGEVLANIDRQVEENLAEVGRRIGGQREWSANIVTDYRFTQGFLKDFNIGTSGRWRSAPLIGYHLTPTGGLDKDHPFKGDDQLMMDSWIGYRLKIKGTTVNLRLRIENVLDEDEPYISRAIDDGTGQPWATTILVPTQRQFVLSANLAF